MQYEMPPDTPCWYWFCEYPKQTADIFEGIRLRGIVPKVKYYTNEGRLVPTEVADYTTRRIVADLVGQEIIKETANGKYSTDYSFIELSGDSLEVQRIRASKVAVQIALEAGNMWQCEYVDPEKGISVLKWFQECCLECARRLKDCRTTESNGIVIDVLCLLRKGELQ